MESGQNQSRVDLSCMLNLLEHMPLESKKNFSRAGPLAFNLMKYGDSYSVSMGERYGTIYAPYAKSSLRPIPEGKTIDDVLADEIASLGERVAYFNIFFNNTLYKKAVTPFVMPE